MTSAYAIESNRRNAKLSTGPTSPEGKARSRFNALNHGATARLLVLPGEDREELDKQRDAWINSRASDDPIERAVVERAFEAWQQLGRTLRAQQGRVEQRMREAELVERQRACDAALELGNRLFRDANGPSQCYPNLSISSSTPSSLSDQTPGDPDQPARLVLRLESTAAGCRWLLDRWNELAELLESDEYWRSPDRFRAIRLLGKNPLDALVDRDVRRIFLACHVLYPETKNPFDDLLHEVAEEHPGCPFPVVRPALKQLTLEPYKPKDPAEARQVLVSLIERAASQLELLLTEHEEREREYGASAADRNAFDLDPDGELMRRYETSCDRAFHRALSQLRLLRKDALSAPAKLRNEPVAASIDRDDFAGETSNHAEPATRNGHILRNEAVAASIDRDDSAGETGSHGELDTRHGEILRNEPVAASVDRDDLASETGDHAEPGTRHGQFLRNEPVAACVDRDDLASETGNHAESDTRHGRILRNEPVAASIDRDDSAGRALPHAPPVAVPPMPPNRQRPRNERAVKAYGNKQRPADSIDVPDPTAPTSGLWWRRFP